MCSSSDDAPKTVAEGCQINSDCNNPLSCTFGRCHTTCAATRDCQSPQRCVHATLGNVCQLEDEAVCLYASQCQPPLKCAVDSRCRNACLSDIDCLPHQTCADGACADADEVAADGHLKDAKDAAVPVDSGEPKSDGMSMVDASVGVDSSPASDATSSTPDANASEAGSADATATDGSLVDGSVADAISDARATDVADGPHHSTAPWHLWVLEQSTHKIYGYPPEQLQTTNGDEPEIILTLPDSIYSFRFDAQGNLWGVLSSATGVVRYPAASLDITGTIAATGKFVEVGTGNVQYLAFDPSGNLWTSGFNGHGEYRYDAAVLGTLTTTANPLTANFKSTTTNPNATAFDAAGNLFGLFYPGGGYASPGRYNASQLVGTGSISDGPALTMTPGLGFYADLLFTASGQLVVASGQVSRYSVTQLAQNGSNVTTTPEAIISLSGVTGFSPTWEAIDPVGNLWLSATKDHVYKLAAADLAGTGALAIAPSMTLRAPVSNATATFSAIGVH